MGGSGFLAGLASLAAPITARVLLALGFAVVTLSGVVVSIDAVKADIIAGLSTGGQQAMMLAGLWGAWQGLGMVFGAVTFACSYWAATQAVRVLGVGQA